MIDGIIQILVLITVFLGLIVIIDGIVNLGIWLLKMDKED